jgi:hypothetical protein
MKRDRQRGVALMALLAVLVLGAAWWLVGALQTPVNRTALERQHNARVLAEAKQALLGYVAMRAGDSAENHPGRMPCPEASAYIGVAGNEGSAAAEGNALTCSNVGRLPWRTLGIDKLRDAAGEPLWYVTTTGASGWAYQNATTVLSINSNKPGGLIVDGSAVVAVIIAPGRSFYVNPDATQTAAGCSARTQNRSTTPPDYRDYLECYAGGATLVSTVANNATNPVLNDQLVVITAADVMQAIEGAVAARMRLTVVPQLQSVYASSAWGTSTATPVFPYAARFQAAGTFNPDNYQGYFGTSQGLLPMTAQTCNATTSGRCDGNYGTSTAFVQWTLASVSVAQTSGTATTFNADCSASTVNEIRCNISYSQLLCLLFCSINSTFRVRADARYVGRTLKTLNPGAASAAPNATAVVSGLSMTAALQTDANASARITYTGTFSGGSASGICGALLSLLCNGSGVITIPITVFQDHPLVNPTTTDAWYWYTVNKWYDVSYYAVASSHLPGGATHNCTTAGDCLAVTGGSPSSNISSLLVLAGRSLSNTGRPNSDLTDFLEDASNRDGNSNFVNGPLHRKTYNDRFVTVSNY